MTAALALWSLFTACCGLTHGFWQLFLMRVGVGVGEAGGIAPAHSMISDYFIPSQRARAFGVYAFGIPLGSAGGLLFGGLIAASIDWRTAFLCVGVFGLVLAPLLATVRDPERGRYDGAPAKVRKASLAAVIAHLLTCRSFWLLAVAAGTSSIMSNALFYWIPSFLKRSYGLTLIEVSLYFGLVTLIGGTLGGWLGSSLADRFGAKNRKAYAVVPALSLLLCVPFLLAGILNRAAFGSLVCFVLPISIGLSWIGPTTAAVQHLVPVEMRAATAAAFLFMNSMIGLAIGSPLIGALSDHLSSRFGAESLRYALLAALGFQVLGAGLFGLAGRTLEADWHDARS